LSKRMHRERESLLPPNKEAHVLDVSASTFRHGAPSVHILFFYFVDPTCIL
jgi:hypothetical protein